MQDPHGSPISECLLAMERGDEGAMERLWQLAYDELHGIAVRLMARERVDHSLQATELLHNAYLRLRGGEELDVKHRPYFFSAMSRAMRRILIEHARRHRSRAHAREGAPERQGPSPDGDVDLRNIEPIDLDEALDSLEREDPECAFILNTRILLGLSVDELATAFNMSKRTVERRIAYARTWLFRRLDLNAK